MSVSTKGWALSLSMFHHPRSVVPLTPSRCPDSILFEHKSKSAVWVRDSINHSFLLPWQFSISTREPSLTNHVESFWSAYKKGFRPHRFGVVQFDVLISAKKYGDRDLCFQARQITAQASVRASAKREMGIVFSLY